MADRHLGLAVFPDEPAADSAAAALKDSGIAHKEAIGVLALNSDGKLKQDKVGKRSAGKGAAIGGVIAVFSTAVLGPAVLAGATRWSASPQEPRTQRRRQGPPHRRPERRQGGSRGDGPPRTAPATSDFLAQRGGTPEGHELTDDALEAAETTETTAV